MKLSASQSQRCLHALIALSFAGYELVHRLWLLQRRLARRHSTAHAQRQALKFERCCQTGELLQRGQLAGLRFYALDSGAAGSSSSRVTSASSETGLTR
jgi:hypothetical protein